MKNDMKEIDPQSTSRALAFELWMKAPIPMVTLMKTLDVTAAVPDDVARVAGFTAKFIDLGPDVQQQIIDRTQFNEA